jgi:hypothetical protein
MRSVLLVLLLAAIACAPRSASVPGAAAAPPKDPELVDVVVSTLPRGHLPEPARGPTGPEVTTGPYVVSAMALMWISGVKNITVTDVADVELRDDEGARTAFCVSEGARTLPQFSMPLSPYDTPMRAERVGDGATPRFDALSLWANSRHEIHKTDESSIPLARIASINGVAVFAFFEEQARVDVVVRRPPLRSGRARYASFFVTPYEGASSAASCSHARVALPVERGNGATAAIDVAVEHEERVRPLHVDVSVLWLASEPQAHLTTRVRWRGPARDELSLTNLANGPL